MAASYLTVKNGGDAVIEVKKSKFIAAVRPVSSEQDALLFLSAMKKKYYDARHHCSAYVIGSREDATEGGNDIVHSSDDGEPSGTAGKPILEVLTGAGLNDVVCVVTRYFGGTLLGTGGLVRAYTDAARAALNASEVVEMRKMQKICCSFDYSMTGKLQHIFNERGIRITDTVYGADVTYTCLVNDNETDTLIAVLTEATAGSAEISRGGSGFYSVV